MKGNIAIQFVNTRHITYKLFNNENKYYLHLTFKASVANTYTDNKRQMCKLIITLVIRYKHGIMYTIKTNYVIQQLPRYRYFKIQMQIHN